MNNVALIAAAECEDAARAAGENASLEDRARAAMKCAKSHWLATNEEDQFSAACEGLARTANEEEMERITDDLGRAQKVNAMLHAMQAGVPVAWDEMEAPEPRENPLGLNKLWREVSDA